MPPKLDLEWRQRYSRGLRKKQDIISDNDIREKGVSDDEIYKIAQEKLPNTFRTNLLEASVIQRRRR